jgi:uncharacterized membrane protein
MRRASLTASSVALPGMWARTRLPARLRARLRLPALVRREPLLFALCGLAALAFGTYSVLRHQHFGSTGYDLGTFDQGIWHLSRFELPEVTTVPRPTIFGDHFHPIILLLVPLYWIWADPQMLLGAQALLIAASIVPIFLFAERRLGRTPAYLFAVAYATFWAVHSAVAFDFHEWAFQPLLMGLILLAVDDRDWKRYWVCVVLLLLVKEDMAVIVIALAGYLLFFREWRRAALTAGLGLFTYLLVTQVLIPFFSDGLEFRHWSYDQFGATLLEALGAMAADPLAVFQELGSPGIKLQTMALLFLPFLGLAICSPVFVLCLPILAERFLSWNFNFWNTSGHYSLTLAPLIVLGAADGLRRVLRLVRSERRRRWAAVAACAAMAAANVYLMTLFPLHRLADPGFYRLSASDRAAQRAIALIPPRASVTAQGRYTPHLTHRNLVFDLRPKAPTAQYFIGNTADLYRMAYPKAGYVDRRFPLISLSRRYYPIFYENDVVVMRRRPEAWRSANRILRQREAAEAAAAAREARSRGAGAPGAGLRAPTGVSPKSAPVG